MKNMLLGCLFALATMSFKPAEEVIYDCDNFAAVVMAIYEDQNGCLTTEEYNAGYNAAKGMCEELQ
jgi:thiamine monophosphate synthase